MEGTRFYLDLGVSRDPPFVFGLIQDLLLLDMGSLGDRWCDYFRSVRNYGFNVIYHGNWMSVVMVSSEALATSLMFRVDKLT